MGVYSCRLNGCRLAKTDHATQDFSRTFVRPFADCGRILRVSAAQGREVAVDLAAEPDFRLGTLCVRPSTCQVVSNGAEERVEPRVMEVLVTLYRAQGQTVTRDRLVEVCWSGRVVSDDAVTRAIAKVRQLARGTEPAPFAVETVPRVGFRLVMTPNPPTPAGPPNTANVITPPPRGTARRRLILAGAAAAAFSIAFVFWAFGGSGAPRAPSVAVLSFAAPQSDNELAQLAERVRDSTARRLAASGVPTVLTEDPSRRQSERPELKVTGRADLQGDKYVITGAISDSATGFVLWSGTSERQTSDVVGIDEEFGRSLSRILGCALHERSAARATLSLEVFSLLLNSCDAIGRQASNAVEGTRRLVAAAPGLAGAHALHAYALAEQARQLDHLSEEAAALTQEMRAAASRALALDPGATFAHVALGVRIGTEARYLEREKNLRRALEIDPSHASARLEYSLLLREVGRLGAALEILTSMDATPGVYVNRAFLYAMTGDVKGANQVLDGLKAVRPDWGRDLRWVVSVWWNKPAAVLPQLESLAEESSRQKNHSCFERLLTALASPGERPVMRGLASDCDGMPLDWQVRMLARQGDIDGAYERMAQAFPKNRQMHMFLFYPEMKAFRHDPRFIPLADRLGLLRYWRDANQWPDFCAEPDLPYDCRQVRTAMPSAQAIR